MATKVDFRRELRQLGSLGRPQPAVGPRAMGHQIYAKRVERSVRSRPRLGLPSFRSLRWFLVEDS